MSLYELARNSVTAGLILSYSTLNQFDHDIVMIKAQRNDHEALQGYIRDEADLEDAFMGLAIAVYDITSERAQDGIEAALKAKDLYKAYMIYRTCLNHQNESKTHERSD